jgi:ABC-type multidrug transport system ATPase subunit
VVEHLEELEEIKDDIYKMNESSKVYRDNKDKLKAQLKKNQSMESIKKTLDQLQNYKNNVTNIFTDALDT